MKDTVELASRFSALFVNSEQPKKQTVESKTVGIHYPLCPSEAEIQYAIVGALRKMGIDARAEVTAKDRKSRFDVVLFHNRTPFGVIEVKKKSRRMFECSRPQVERYEVYGIPVLLACGPRNIILAVRWAKNRYKEVLKVERELRSNLSRI